jgi:hypothetical protein
LTNDCSPNSEPNTSLAGRVQAKVAALMEIHGAMIRETIRERVRRPPRLIQRMLFVTRTYLLSNQTHVLTEYVCTASASSKLAVAARSGLQSTVNLLVTLIQSIGSHHNATVATTVVATISELLSALGAGGLGNGNQEPNSEITDALQPLNGFLLNEVALSSHYTNELRTSAILALLDLALARGSLDALLSAIHTLITNPNLAELRFPVGVVISKLDAILRQGGASSTPEATSFLARINDEVNGINAASLACLIVVYIDRVIRYNLEH